MFTKQSSLLTLEQIEMFKIDQVLIDALNGSELLSDSVRPVFYKRIFNYKWRSAQTNARAKKAFRKPSDSLGVRQEGEISKFKVS